MILGIFAVFLTPGLARYTQRYFGSFRKKPDFGEKNLSMQETHKLKTF